LLATAAVCAGTSATASAEVVYNNIPIPLPGNQPSQPFQAQQASEFGGLVQLAPSTLRNNPTVTVAMSSWGCQSGSGATCQTTPGSKFSEPITLNLYNVGANHSVGSLIASRTETFEIPFRPSADPTHCPVSGTVNGKTTDGTQWFDGTNCNNGMLTEISFDLTSATLTLPDTMIVSVAYNTSTWGYQPYGTSAFCATTPTGCGYDSLNVALNTIDAHPSVGSDPDPGDAYINSATPNVYCDGGAGGVTVFRLDAPAGAGTPCWTGFQPAIAISATAPAVGPQGPPGTPGTPGGVAPGVPGPRGPHGPEGPVTTVSCSSTPRGAGTQTVCVVHLSSRVSGAVRATLRRGHHVYAKAIGRSVRGSRQQFRVVLHTRHALARGRYGLVVSPRGLASHRFTLVVH
jgi:hypothetical protein